MALLAVHGLVGLALFPTGARLGRRAFLVAALAPLATLAWLLTQMPGIVDGDRRHRARHVGRARSASTSTCASTGSPR